MVPESIHAACRRAHDFRLAGHAEAAESGYRHILGLVPHYEEAALSLAFLLREQGRLGSACKVVLDYWSVAERSAGHDLKAIKFLVECGRHGDARGIVVAAVRDYPGNAALMEHAAVVTHAVGSFDEAAQLYRLALRIDPLRPGAWLRLANTHVYDEPESREALAEMDRLLAASTAGELKAALGFCKGKILDDIGRHAAACDAWRNANELVQGAARFPVQEARPAQGHGWRITPPIQTEDRAPLFIVGMPRSGTTLLSRLLARMDDIRERGELGWLPELLARTGGSPAMEVLMQARAIYLQQLFQDDGPARWYVDKNPLNYRHLAAVAGLFPEARVIFMRRSPRDVALSLWSQHFAHEGMRWSYRFEGIAAEMDRCRQALEDAQQLLGDRLRIVDYRDLVETPDPVIAELGSWLGVGESPNEPSAGEAITTASVWQARQPIYKTSLERWRRYLDYLPELSGFDPG